MSIKIGSKMATAADEEARIGDVPSVIVGDQIRLDQIELPPNSGNKAEFLCYNHVELKVALLTSRMSIEELPEAVGLISNGLKDLLARARTAKPSTSDVIQLSTRNQFSAIETAARNIFNDTLVREECSDHQSLANSKARP